MKEIGFDVKNQVYNNEDLKCLAAVLNLNVIVEVGDIFYLHKIENPEGFIAIRSNKERNHAEAIKYSSSKKLPKKDFQDIDKVSFTLASKYNRQVFDPFKDAAKKSSANKEQERVDTSEKHTDNNLSFTQKIQGISYTEVKSPEELFDHSGNAKIQEWKRLLKGYVGRVVATHREQKLALTMIQRGRWVRWERVYNDKEIVDFFQNYVPKKSEIKQVIPAPALLSGASNIGCFNEMEESLAVFWRNFVFYCGAYGIMVNVDYIVKLFRKVELNAMYYFAFKEAKSPVIAMQGKERYEFWVKNGLQLLLVNRYNVQYPLELYPIEIHFDQDNIYTTKLADAISNFISTWGADDWFMNMKFAAMNSRDHSFKTDIKYHLSFQDILSPAIIDGYLAKRLIDNTKTKQALLNVANEAVFLCQIEKNNVYPESIIYSELCGYYFKFCVEEFGLQLNSKPTSLQGMEAIKMSLVDIFWVLRRVAVEDEKLAGLSSDICSHMKVRLQDSKLFCGCLETLKVVRLSF